MSNCNLSISCVSILFIKEKLFTKISLIFFIDYSLKSNRIFFFLVFTIIETKIKKIIKIRIRENKNITIILLL
ncbi:hypothetical protein MYM_0662 [Mesomycoplasma hyorhinis GDL-1]|nr:hypothetical protein MYM_0662 [Mesomycoplasma hyorhinis GDL-1]